MGPKRSASLPSLVYRAFGGETTTAELVKEFLSTLIASLQTALLPALAAAGGLPLGAGLTN